MSTRRRSGEPPEQAHFSPESGQDADPMREREAQKYEFPVPSREAVIAFLTERGTPAGYRDIIDALAVTGERDLEAFSRRLRAMERDGQIMRNRRGTYGLVPKMDLVRGRVLGHPDGFGFLIPDEGGEDLFLTPREMRRAMSGDRVMARVAGLDARGRKEGAVVEVLERGHKTLVGRLQMENRIAVVIPADRRISQQLAIAPGDEGAAQHGQIVVAEITEYPSSSRPAVGRVVEVLGDHLAPGMEVEIAIRMHELPHEFPGVVRDEVSGLSPEVPEAAKQGREDLRQMPLVTIDGEDARDFDDAVFCERVGRDFRLVVAIADVAAYVKPGTALDTEGFARGNSVYFPNYVIPMLPEILSNGLCSLNPKVDRLCMVCDMQVSARGKIKEFRFTQAVMRSHARLTYTKVAKILVEQDAALRQEYAAVLPHLENLHALYQVLHQERAARGAVDFELPETRIIYNAMRKIDRIEAVERNDAHRLIEECMLAANVCAAEFLSEHKLRVPFRIHAGPTPEKLVALREFLFSLGLDLGGGDEPKAKDYSKLLESVKGREDARLIHTVMLRSLQQAVYSPDNIGHFALGFPRYTHFTSPIRRYPDLIVHRTIKSVLEGRPADLSASATQAEHLSMTERRADDATREVVRWLKVEFMLDRVGQEFEGMVSGVAGFGLFVELKDIYVDGLVHISTLGNDYFHFDAAKHRIMGERTNQIFRLGDTVRVRVVRADLDEARLDFELVGTVPRSRGGRVPEAGAGAEQPKRKKGRRRGGKKKRSRDR